MIPIRRIISSTFIMAALLFLTVSVSIFQVGAEVNTPEPANSGLLAWWKLNEGAGTVVSDSSGNNYQGIIHGAGWMNDEENNSLNFNGVSDYVSLPSLDLRDLDSLTVVAWIKSDLTEVGFVVYNGYLGEFELGNGDLGQDTQALNINSTYASFNVKLSSYNWYRAQSSSPMKPNTWHQIVGVWIKGVSLKVYVDGVLAGENDHIEALNLYDPGSSYPSSLGIYSQDRWDQQDFFKGQISNVMVFDKALTTQEISALYSAPTLAKPTLNLSCKSSASYSGFNAEIKGNLTLNETAISNAPIQLSYSVNGGKTWQDLTLVYTRPDGSYAATWLPSVTGNYLVKVVYDGDSEKMGAQSEIVNFAVTEFAEKDILFSVSSNSTITSLAFNSTTSELTFEASGPAETTGYVQATIAKSLVANPENIKVYLDGNQLNYSVAAAEDSWLITFTYSHSKHEILLYLGSATTSNVPFNVDYRVLLGVGIFLAASITIIVVVVRRMKKTLLVSSK